MELFALLISESQSNLEATDSVVVPPSDTPLAIASAIIGGIGVVLTILTFIQTGRIKKAVTHAKAEAINKIKYCSRREDYLEKLSKIRKKLISLSCSDATSSDILKIFQDFCPIVLDLSECTDHYRKKHKVQFASYEEYCKESSSESHIFGDDDCKHMLICVNELIMLLNQEEYYS